MEACSAANIIKKKRALVQPLKHELRAEIAELKADAVERRKLMQTFADSAVAHANRETRNAGIALAGWTAFVILAVWVLI